MSADHLFDVVGVSIATNKILWTEGPKTLRNAEAIVKMAVWRRGSDKEFFSEVPAGKYKIGDEWSGP